MKMVYVINADDVRVQLDKIRKEASKGDPEAAHMAQDDLYRDVLDAIARGCNNHAELAALALTAKEIEFQRWYA